MTLNDLKVGRKFKFVPTSPIMQSWLRDVACEEITGTIITIVDTGIGDLRGVWARTEHRNHLFKFGEHLFKEVSLIPCGDYFTKTLWDI